MFPRRGTGRWSRTTPMPSAPSWPTTGSSSARTATFAIRRLFSESLLNVGVGGRRTHQYLEPTPFHIPRHDPLRYGMPVCPEMVETVSHNHGSVKVYPGFIGLEGPRPSNRCGFLVPKFNLLHKSPILIESNHLRSEGIGCDVES